MMADPVSRRIGAHHRSAHNPVTGKASGPPNPAKAAGAAEVAESAKRTPSPGTQQHQQHHQQHHQQRQQHEEAEQHQRARCREPSNSVDDASQPNPTRGTGKKKMIKKKQCKAAAGSVAKKTKKAVISANLANTNYEMVRQVCRELGFKIKTSPSSMDCNLLWFDCCPPGEVFSKLLPYQRMNHFPGTGQITRKDNLARNLNRLLRACGSEALNIFPRSWVLPADLQHFRNYIDDCKKGKGKGGKRKRKTFIYKPINGARGVGISVTQNPAQIPTHESLLVQEYLPKPFLVEGYKFDLRLYVLLTSCDPLRIYLFKDGLVRLSTTPYKAPTKKNVADVTMHLTNYSLNKGTDGFQQTDEDDTGSKRTYQWLLQHLREKHGADTDRLQRRIADVIIKTVIVSLPFVRQGYAACQLHQARDKQGRAAPAQSMCFEILGFDILLTSKLKPYIIEVNRAPSFTCDSQLDARIKHGVLHSALRMMHIRTKERTRWQQRAKESAMRRLHARSQSSSTQRASKRRNNKGGASVSSPVTRTSSTHSVGDDHGSEDGCSNTISSATATAAQRQPKLEPGQDSVAAHKDENAPNKSDSDQGEEAGSDSDDEDASLCTSGSQDAIDKATRRQMVFEDTAKGDYARIFPVGNETLMLQYEALITTSSKVVQASVGTVRGRQPQQTFGGRACDTTPANASPASSASASSTHGKASSPRLPARTPTSGAFVQRSSVRATRKGPGDRGLAEPRSPAPGLPSRSSSSPSWITRRTTVSRAAASARAATFDRSGVVDEGLTRLLHHLSLNGAAAIGIDTFEDDVVERASEVEENFIAHRARMARFWLRTLPPSERHRTLGICRQRILDTASSLAAETLSPRATRVVARAFDRLAFSHGQGLWNSFTLPSCSWQSIEPLMALVSPTDQEKMLCSRLVFLTKQLLLCLYAKHDLTFSEEAEAAEQPNAEAVAQPEATGSPRHPCQQQPAPPNLQLGAYPSQLRRQHSQIDHTDKNQPSTPVPGMGGVALGKGIADSQLASPGGLRRQLVRRIASPYSQRSTISHKNTSQGSASPSRLQTLVSLPVQTISFDRCTAPSKR